jgi:hypothetical protein
MFIDVFFINILPLSYSGQIARIYRTRGGVGKRDNRKMKNNATINNVSMKKRRRKKERGFYYETYYRF